MGEIGKNVPTSGYFEFMKNVNVGRVGITNVSRTTSDGWTCVVTRWVASGMECPSLAFGDAPVKEGAAEYVMTSRSVFAQEVAVRSWVGAEPFGGGEVVVAVAGDCGPGETDMGTRRSRGQRRGPGQ